MSYLMRNYINNQYKNMIRYKFKNKSKELMHDNNISKNYNNQNNCISKMTQKNSKNKYKTAKNSPDKYYMEKISSKNGINSTYNYANYVGDYVNNNLLGSANKKNKKTDEILRRKILQIQNKKPFTAVNTNNNSLSINQSISNTSSCLINQFQKSKYPSKINQKKNSLMCYSNNNSKVTFEYSHGINSSKTKNNISNNNNNSNGNINHVKNNVNNNRNNYTTISKLNFINLLQTHKGSISYRGYNRPTSSSIINNKNINNISKPISSRIHSKNKKNIINFPNNPSTISTMHKEHEYSLLTKYMKDGIDINKISNNYCKAQKLNIINNSMYNKSISHNMKNFEKNNPYLYNESIGNNNCNTSKNYSNPKNQTIKQKKSGISSNFSMNRPINKNKANLKNIYSNITGTRGSSIFNSTTNSLYKNKGNKSKFTSKTVYPSKCNSRRTSNEKINKNNNSNKNNNNIINNISGGFSNVMKINSCREASLKNNNNNQNGYINRRNIFQKKCVNNTNYIINNIIRPKDSSSSQKNQKNIKNSKCASGFQSANDSKDHIHFPLSVTHNSTLNNLSNTNHKSHINCINNICNINNINNINSILMIHNNNNLSSRYPNNVKKSSIMENMVNQMNKIDKNKNNNENNKNNIKAYDNYNNLNNFKANNYSLNSSLNNSNMIKNFINKENNKPNQSNKKNNNKQEDNIKNKLLQKDICDISKSSKKEIGNTFDSSLSSSLSSLLLPAKPKSPHGIDESSESLGSTLLENGIRFVHSRDAEAVASFLRSFFREKGRYPGTRMRFYKYGRVLGRGAFGKVNLALHALTGRLVAIKSINKKKITSEKQRHKIELETNILKTLSNSNNVVKFFETFETKKHICIVTEYICAGDLLSYIKKRSKLSESVARFIFKQIMLALDYIHSHNIVHRDIKLDNILIDLDNTIKICDFGVSRNVREKDRMYEQCGTPAYIAPEILLGKGYEGFSVDIWSAGVVLYAMLTGTVPFKGSGLNELHSLIMKGNYTPLKDVSKEAVDLIQCILEVDPKKRISIKGILNHDWFNNNSNEYKIQSLFTNAEHILLAKSNVDYRNINNKEDMVENFDLRNLMTQEEKVNKNVKTHSVILAPFNSSVTEESNVEEGLMTLNNIIKFPAKVKDINRNYELNNNQEIDNGVVISPNHSEDSDELNKEEPSNGGHSLKAKSKKLSSNCIYNDINDMNIYYDRVSDPKINEEALKELNDLGYTKKYVEECIKKSEFNYATAGYKLLVKYMSLKRK